MQPTEAARARLNESLGMHAPDDISEFLQELVGLSADSLREWL
jgi:hypothetical protein